MTVADPPEPNVANLRRTAAHCRRCRHQVGEYVDGGKGLRVEGGPDQAAITIRQRLTFFCSCGGRNKFRPGVMDG